MKFSSMLLLVDDEKPTLATFEKVIELGSRLYRKGKYLYSVEHEIVDNRFYWAYFQYDNETLYTEMVIDTNDDLPKINPRPKNLVEMRYQLFTCYDIQQQLLYISDYQKKGLVTDYISEAIQLSATVRNVYASVEDFVESVKYLKSVVFTQVNTIYNADEESIFKKVASLYGLDLPEKSKVHLDYGSTPIGAIRNAMRDWKLHREQGQFEDVVVIGTADDGLERTFNFSTLISSVEVEAGKNDDDRYDPIIIRVLLLTKIER